CLCLPGTCEGGRDQTPAARLGGGRDERSHLAWCAREQAECEPGAQLRIGNRGAGKPSAEPEDSRLQVGARAVHQGEETRRRAARARDQRAGGREGERRTGTGRRGRDDVAQSVVKGQEREHALEGSGERLTVPTAGGGVLTAPAAARVGGARVAVLRAEDLVVDGPQDAAARACARVARRADRHGTVLAGPATLVHGNMHASTRDAAIVRARDRVVAGGVVQAAARKRRADANARVTAVRDRAGVPVVANGSLELHGVRAGAGRGVARPRVVALVLGSADDRVRAGANSPLTGVGLRARVPVIAGRAIRLSGVRAGPGGRVARPGVVTLVGRGADDGVAARAHAPLAGVGLRARVAVVAGAAVGLGGVRARAGGRVARPRVVTLVGCGADDGVPARAHAALAGVGARAGVVVVARASVGLDGVRARARGRVAGARVVTLVGCGAHDGVPARAHAAPAGVGSRAGVVVVARAPVGLDRSRARAGGRVARPGVVTLVGHGADDEVAARAHAPLAGVGLRARVAVVAGAAVGLGGVRAGAGRRVARPRVV